MNLPYNYLLGILTSVSILTSAQAADRLDQVFANPPPAAHPHTWWHWVNGNVSKEGITLDLEAMKRIGVTGAQIFNVKQAVPDGPVQTGGAEWLELTKFAIQEADRLGVELTMHNCPGYSLSGGPWVTPEQAMQKVVWTETHVKGGALFGAKLPQPETVLNHYRDIAVLAFPLEADESHFLAAPPRVTTSGQDGAPVEARPASAEPTVIAFSTEKKRQFIQVEFAAPVKASFVAMKGSIDRINVTAQLEASDDGKTYRRVTELPMANMFSDGFIGFPETTARFYRIDWTLNEDKAGKIKLTSVQFAARRITASGPKAGYRPDLNLRFTDKPLQGIDRARLIDLTAKLGPDGTLDWQVPPGNWTVIRLGHTPTGKKNLPAPDTATGLECDKFSRAAVEAHFAGMMGKVIAEVGPLAGKSFKMVLADSWEAESQNWTPAMRAEFTRLRGYDPLPWLPCIAGHVVGSLEESERFLWDFRRSIADLIAENHYGTFQELCRKNNLLFTAEAPGIGMPAVADQLQCKARTDVPMGEFWFGGNNDSKEAATAAHIGGQTIAAAEAFTAKPGDAKWAKAPFDFKAIGDMNFARGINRLVFHRYAMQPWKDRLPGMTMGPWGSNFERTNTWWEQAKPWMDYLSRSQALLQAGLFQADVLYFYGEGAPITLTRREPSIPAGYDYDAIDAEALLQKLTFTDGRLTLPSGMTYRVLLLPTTDRLTPAMLRKIKDLAAAGATVLGVRPIKSPSLSGFPKCDAEVTDLANELWGAPPHAQATGSQTIGKGRVIWGKPLADLLAESGVKPDFETSNPKDKCAWIHRRAGDADIYFLSNQSSAPARLTATFRVSGKIPELWHPDSGKTGAAPIFTEKDGRTTLQIPFDPAGSVFVVFRKPSSQVDAVISATRDGGDAFLEDAGGELTIEKAVYGATPDVGPTSVDVTGKLTAAVQNGRLRVTPNNDLCGRDPAFGVVKRLWVDYSYKPKKADAAGLVQKRAVVGEDAVLELPEAVERTHGFPSFELAWTGDPHTLIAGITQPGSYEVKTRSGKTLRATVKEVPESLTIHSPWVLRFPPKWGAPDQVTLQKLISWADHPEEGVRQFSGTATYSTEFDWKKPSAPARHYLDLGTVKEIAHVLLNGKDLGILWKPPFRVDVTTALKAGRNRLEVRVTNLWPNRLIGDAALPESQRHTWSTFQPYKAEDPLLPSGLLGPVTLRTMLTTPL